jgi:hypothetical protein
LHPFQVGPDTILNLLPLLLIAVVFQNCRNNFNDEKRVSNAIVKKERRHHPHLSYWVQTS